MSDVIKSQLREALIPVFTEKIPSDERVSGLFAALNNDPERRDPHITLLAGALGGLIAGHEVNYGALAHWHQDIPVTPEQFELVVGHLVDGLTAYDQANETTFAGQLMDAYGPVKDYIEDAIVNGPAPDNPPAA